MLHCSELRSPTSLSPGVGLVLSVQHQGLTEQWRGTQRGSDSGSCWNCQLEPLTLPAGAGCAPFRSKCEHFITTALWQFGTGKDFLCKFPWSHRRHDGEDFVPRVGWCRLMHNNFSDRDAFDELGESEKQFKIRALQKVLQNCCQLRRNTGLILLAVVLLSGASFCRFKPLVCHLASHDFTVMKMKVYSTNDDVCGGK